jgi:hypothetical protein
MTVELQLVKGRGLLEQWGVVSGSSHGLLEVGETLPEGEMLRQLHKTNQVASATTAVTVEQIFAAIDGWRVSDLADWSVKSGKVASL